MDRLDDTPLSLVIRAMIDENKNAAVHIILPYDISISFVSTEAT